MTARSTIEGVQALRAVAALLVVLDHMLLRLVEAGELPIWWEGFAYRSGAVGVMVFFAISGFVMAHADGEKRGRGAAGRFLWRRVVRIVPLYWLVTLAYVLYRSLTGVVVDGGRVLRSLFFIPYLDAAGEMRPVVGVGWTLNYEMYFYLLFATGLLLPGRWGSRVVMAVLVLSVLLGSFLPQGDAWATLTTSPMLLCFAGGLLVHRQHMRGGKVPGGPVSAALLVVAMLVLPMPTWLLASAFAPLIVWSVADAARLPGRAWRPLLVMGEASYSLYLTHVFVLGPVAALVLGWGLWSFFGTATAASIAVALLVHFAFERPLLLAARGAAGGRNRSESRDAMHPRVV